MENQEGMEFGDWLRAHFVNRGPNRGDGSWSNTSGSLGKTGNRRGGNGGGFFSGRGSKEEGRWRKEEKGRGTDGVMKGVGREINKFEAIKGIGGLGLLGKGWGREELVVGQRQQALGFSEDEVCLESFAKEDDGRGLIDKNDRVILGMIEGDGGSHGEAKEVQRKGLARGSLGIYGDIEKV